MSYLPDTEAVLDGTPFTRQLSQRDLSLQIPVNYVTLPAVVLTPACFPHNRYEDATAIKCFSNLLAIDFRRFVADIYWDSSRSVWSLCPAELGDPPSNNVARSRNTDRKDRIVLPRQDGGTSDSLNVASTLQQTSSSSLNSVSTTVTLNTDSSPAPAQPTGTDAAGTAIQIGPYFCTRSATLNLLLEVLASHLDNTQTNVNATVKYLILNLHEASRTGSDPVTLSGDQLPHGSSRLGTILNAPAANLSQYLFTPDNLADQRADLNATFSWFSVNPSKEPNPSYFTIDQSNGHASTPNGWPAESFVEMTQAKRLIVGIGDVDAQLSDYDYSADAAPIFSSSYLQDSVAVALAANGDITSGCFFNSTTTQVSAVNNSWASVGLVSSSFTNLEASLDAATSLTRCGITPVLNATLGGVTADQNYEPYRDFVQSTVWSWAPGEPVNNTTPGSDDPSISNRCAVLNAASGYWQTENCYTSHYSACRSFAQPYEWIIGDVHTTYDKADLGCKDNTEFDTPRTALENRYLLRTWRETIASRDVDNGNLLWVNFNDLDAKACWVIGQNATCPYLKDMNEERILLVPTVAAVVVFVLAALTVFVKCASNRQSSKRRRRRGDDGWDYEGVPS